MVRRILNKHDCSSLDLRYGRSLLCAGGLAAALSTAAGLLLVISTAIAHDLLKGCIAPELSEKQELTAARIAVGFAVCVAGYFGINPP